MRRGNASGQFTVGRPDRSVVAVFVALAVLNVALDLLLVPRKVLGL